MTKSIGATYTIEEYENDPILDLTALVVCEDDEPPKYESDSSRSHI